MTPRLNEIKARVAEADGCIDNHTSPMTDLAWLIAEVERLQPNPLGCHIGQCRGDETGQLVTACSFHRKVDENAKLREENERLLRNERNAGKDIVIEKLRADLDDARRQLIERQTEHCFKIENDWREPQGARLGRGGG